MQPPPNPKVKTAIRYFPMADGAYHVYDPTSSRHFKLGAQEVQWLSLLDGSKAHGELLGKIPFEYFEDFFRNLDRMALLEGAVAPRERFNPLKIKIFKVDPSGLLDALAPMAAPYRTALNIVTWPIVFLNFFLFSGIVAGVPGLLPPLQLALGHLQLGLLAVAFYLVAVTMSGAMHEMSHGIVARSYGVHVPAFGFMLLMLNPAFYADVSGINNLTRRKERIQVLAAGIKANNVLFFIGAIAYIAQHGTLLESFWLIFSLMNFAQCLINLIPFVAYDGYYIFQELMVEARYSTNAIAATLSATPGRLDYMFYTIISFCLRFSLAFLVINRLRTFVKGYWSSIYVDVLALVLFALTWAFVFRRTLQPQGRVRA